METLELFCGTKSFSKIAKEKGHKTFTIDNDKQHNPDLCIDILNFNIDMLPNEFKKPDFIWASPPCTTFSVASIGTHWTGGKNSYIPKTDKSKIGLEILDKTISIIKDSNCKYWVIENPRGVMRKVIDNIFKKYNINNYKRFTVTYCQYGDTRMKPTDIWTNIITWKPKSICKNGASCHISAPRGSKTGTQGLKGAKERGVVPDLLIKEILNSVK